MRFTEEEEEGFFVARTALSLHARLTTPCQDRLSLYLDLFSSRATVLHAGRVRASVVSLSIFLRYHTNFDIRNSGRNSAIPDFTGGRAVRRILGSVRSILGAVRRILGAVRRILGAVRSILGAVRRMF